MYYFRLLNHNAFSVARNIFRCASNLVIGDVSCFGLLVVRNTRFTTRIKPIDPLDVPNGDKIFIDTVKSNGSQMEEDLFNIKHDKEKSILYVSEVYPAHSNDLEDVILDICIPHQYDIDVVSQSVDIIETEGQNLKVLCNGDCTLGKIKSANTQIKSHGHIECKSFLGDGFISGGLSLSMRKLQSKQLVMKSNGDVNIAAVYSGGSFKCQSTDGSVHINSLHGDSHIQGNEICIASMSGDLNAETKSGDINVLFDHTNESSLSTVDGDINISVTDSVSAFIEAEGTSIDVPEDLLFDGVKYNSCNGKDYFEGKLGDAQSSIMLVSEQGNITLSKESLSSIFNLES